MSWGKGGVRKSERELKLIQYFFFFFFLPF